MGERVAEAFLILLLATHVGSQVGKVDTLTDSRPCWYSIELDDPTPKELKNPEGDGSNPGPPTLPPVP